MTEFDTSGSGFSRRSILGGMGGAGLLAAGTTSARADSHTAALDFSKKEDQLTAIIKMRASMDNSIVMGGVTGLYYGVVDNRITPLFGVLAGTMSRYKQLDEWRYEGVTFEVAYFTDWNTGELLETFDNPFTGKTVEVPQTRMGPSKLIIGIDGREIPSDNPRMASMDISHRFIPPRVEHDDVILVEELHAGTKKDFPGQAFHFNEVTTYRAKMADLVNPDVMIANENTHFNVVVTWRPWLNMGDHAGHMLGTAPGGRYATVDDFPPYYVELTNKYHPDVFGDTAALLASVED